MPAETYNGYFRNFTKEDILPGITWQEMLSARMYIGPRPLLRFLSEAKTWLIEEEGPNLINRILYVPGWLDLWIKLLRKKQEISDEIIYDPEVNVATPFGEVAELIERNGRIGSGIIFMAGGEGHGGHRYAIDYMKRDLKYSVLALEEDVYNETHKVRGGNFLPLEVRISMWLHYGVRCVTVLPTQEEGIDINTHYQSLFAQSGAERFAFTASDPDAWEKRQRGNPLIIPHRDTEIGTTDRVKRLMEDDSDFENLPNTCCGDQDLLVRV